MQSRGGGGLESGYCDKCLLVLTCACVITSHFALTSFDFVDVAGWAFAFRSPNPNTISVLNFGKAICLT